MARQKIRQSICIVILLSFVIWLTGCVSSARGRYFGKTVAPSGNVLHYISGSEPESLDPPISTGQPEARVYMALYDGLVEYHPKTMEPIPSIAESWDLSKDGTEYLFHLRQNAKFSNGDPITAKDFVYSIRRAFSPEIASRNASLGYPIKYAEAYNSGAMFVKDSSGNFLLKKDASDDEGASEATLPTGNDNLGNDSDFHKFLDAPERLTVPGDEKGRAKDFEKNPKLKALVDGKELVPVKGEDIGVEAVDSFTLRIKLRQPAPYFIGLLGHQMFRVVHQGTIEKYGKAWTNPQNIVTSGAFKLVKQSPYDVLILAKDPNNWDAANVKLDGIEFYPLEDANTMMNLYKAGSADAFYNHTVPASWVEEIRDNYKDEYLNFPEVAIEYYAVAVKKPPMDNLKVRQAFALAIDREALAKFRKTTKPLVDFTPEGTFPQYEEARAKIYSEKLKEKGISQEQWAKRVFDPEKARKLLAEVGYSVEGTAGNYSCKKFPVEKVNITYNTAENNKAMAEFIQAQWKQNLGITVQLKNMEWKTYLAFRSKVEFEGMSRNGWVGDYMDPFTFLERFYSPSNDSCTGWWDAKYDKLLDDANKEIDPQKRFEKMAEAEFYVMDQQIVIPLQTQATNWMKKPYVKGMYPNPGTLHAWKFVYIEHDPSKWDSNVDDIMKQKDPSVEKQLDTLMSVQKAKEAEAKAKVEKAGK